MTQYPTIAPKIPHGGVGAKSLMKRIVSARINPDTPIPQEPARDRKRSYPREKKEEGLKVG